MLIKIGFVWQYLSLLIIVSYRQKSWFWPITRLLLEPASSSVAAVAADRLSHDGPISITEISSREIPLHFLIIESQYDLIILKTCYLKDNHLFSSSLQLPSFAVFTYTIKPSGAICFCGVTVNIGRPSMSNLSLSHFLLNHYHSFLTIELLIRFSCLQKAPHRG